MTIALARPRRLRGEAGATLVELLTAMVVSAVVLAFVTGTVVNALRSQRRQTTQVAALNDARVAFERVTRDIRGAHPLQVAAGDLIALQVRAPDGAVRVVTYGRVGDSLVTTDGATGVARPLVKGLAPGQPLFLFHLADGSASTGAVLDPRSVESITVRFRVDPPGAGRVVDLQNRVTVRNAVI